jgi:hypothetical protein
MVRDPAEPTIIKIDRSTVRPNPRAGQSVYRVYGQSHVYETRVFQLDGHWIQEKYSDGFLCSKDISSTEECPPEWIPSFSHTQDYQDLHTLCPEGQFLYEYENPEITCYECGGVFKYRELDTDDLFDGEDDLYCDTVCPLCKAWYCCEPVLERLEPVKGA